MKIGHSNVNSLVRKLPFVQEFLEQHKVYIMCVTETHLLRSMPDSFIHIGGFRVVCNDTEGTFAKHGVCIYVNNCVKFDVIVTNCANCVAIHLPDLDLYIVAIYRPPSSTPVENQCLQEFLLSFCMDKEVLLLGDFNLPSLSWRVTDPSSQASVCDAQFHDVFVSLGLTQWVSEPTYPRSGSILDLVLSTEDDRVGSVVILPPLPGCDHCPTVCDYVFDYAHLSCQSESQTRKWNRGKYDRISRELNTIDWDTEFMNCDTNHMYCRFLDILTPLIHDFVPVSKAFAHSAPPPWRTNPPRSLRTCRKEAWDKYKKVRHRLGRNSVESESALRTFFSANRSLKRFALDSQASYERKLLEESSENPKLLHAYLRRRKVGCPGVGPLRLPNGNLTDDPVAMAESFAKAFEGVFVRGPPNPDPAPHQTVDSQMPGVDISINDVLAVLQSLDANSSAGPDNLHPMLLKSCAHSLAYPLTVIFRQSLMEHSLPNHWKTSIVVPIFKKGSRYDPLNYRPISLTAVTCKCLERVICQQLTAYLENNFILSDNQFGFRSGRSTQDQLLLVYDDVAKWLDDGCVVDLIMFDFAKAFDLVSHPILLEKLRLIGITSPLIYWIEDFLVGRSMSVSVKGNVSRSYPVASGVPQGSVLGPILFLVFINHIANTLNSSYKIFADDLKVYIKIGHDSDADYALSSQLFQRDITALQEISTSWDLRLNEEKCVVMRFQRKSHPPPPPVYYIGGSPIRVTLSHSDLGVLIDTSLKFHQHISTTVRKAAGLSQNLLKCTVCRSPDFMLTLFRSHIRPIIEYYSCLWHTRYLGDLRMLESVQRRWTKCIADMSNLDYRCRLRALNLFSVQGRLLRADMIQCWKMFHGKCAVNAADLFTLAPQAGTRGHRFKVCHSRPHTDVRQRSFSVRCVGFWNSLPEQVVSETDFRTFKVLLADALGDSLFDYQP